MSLYKTELQFRKACEIAGIEVNGSRPQDPHINNEREFYSAFARNPFLAIGENYAAQHYDVEDLGSFLRHFAQGLVSGDLEGLLSPRQKWNLFFYHLTKQIRNPDGTRNGQHKIAHDHYDLDNELMESMLGSTMKYTGGLWLPEYGSFELDKAQELDLLVAGLCAGLKEGMRVLDIGFGFGTNTKYLVERFGINVTGITISSEQKAYAEKVCADISDKVRFVLSDWRDITAEQLGTFDRVINFEMIESIGGPKNYPAFFQFMSDALEDEGIIFMQAITGRKRVYATNPFIDKYIFPNGVLPTPEDLDRAARLAGLYPVESKRDILTWSYGQTCKAWSAHFVENWDTLRNMQDSRLGITKSEKYKRHFKKRFPYEMAEETFPRLWQQYLLSCYAGHDAGYMNDGHFMWSKKPEIMLPEIPIPKTKEEVDMLFK